jgi:hypothetical protein
VRQVLLALRAWNAPCYAGQRSLQL